MPAVLVIWMRIIVNRIMPLKDLHILIPRICDYVTLCGNRSFPNVIKVKDFEMGRIDWFIQVDPI